MIKYIILQGVCSLNGSGDTMPVENPFDNYEAAKECFDSIKTKTKGWVMHQKSILTTYLEKIDDSFDEDEDEYSEIIEGFECNRDGKEVDYIDKAIMRDGVNWY